MSKRARFVVAAFVLLLGLSPAATTAVADEPAPVPGCRRVAVVGDSLTVGSAKQLVALLGAEGVRNIAVDGRRGRQIRSTATYSGVRTVRDLRAKGFDADCFVVALGTNDVLTSASELRYAASIAEMLDEIGDLPVLWVDVVNGRYPARALVFNLLLAQAAATRSNLQIAHWTQVMAFHPEWTTRDKVHLKAAGYQARAEWLTAHVLAKLVGTPPDDDVTCAITVRLRYPMRHPQVECLEARLAAFGYPLAGPPDDRFDRATYRALARFQKWHILGPSGVTTASTVAALGLSPPPP